MRGATIGLALAALVGAANGACSPSGSERSERLGSHVSPAVTFPSKGTASTVRSFDLAPATRSSGAVLGPSISTGPHRAVMKPPAIGPELDIVDPAFAPAQGHGNQASWNGSAYLVAWTKSPQEVIAARVDATGAVLDAPGILVAGTGGGADVSWDGTNHWIAWYDNRGGIYAARITPDGTIVDPGGFPITTGPPTSPRLHWDGSHHLIAYWGPAGHLGVRVAPDGTILDDPPLVLGPSGSLAFNGTHYLLVWSSGSELFGKRTNPNGSLVGPVSFPILLDGRKKGNPRVASDGTDWLVAWTDFTDPLVRGAAGTSVSAAGIPDPVGVRYSPIGATEDKTVETLAWTGYGYALHGSEEVSDGTIGYSRLLDSTGQIVGLLPSDGLEGCDVAPGTGEFLVLCNKTVDGPGTPEGVYGIRVSPAITELTSGYISLEGALRTPRDIAAGPSEYFVTWTDWRRASTFLTEIRGARVDSVGNGLDLDGLLLGPIGSEYSHVGHNGSSYLVAWFEGAKRVSSGGSVLDPSPIDTGVESAAYGASSRVGAHHLVVGGFGDIEAVRIDASGTVLDSTPVSISSGNGGDASWNGSSTLIVWQDGRNGDSDIYGARMLEDGTVLDPTGIPIVVAPGDQRRPVVSWDGAAHLVVWENQTGIHATRLDIGGLVLGELTVSIDSGAQRFPEVAWDGKHHVVIWRSGTEVRLARVTSAGNVVDASSVLVSADAESPRIASLGNGRSLIAYSAFVPERQNKDLRGRLITAECTDDTECASGFCVDGVCCDSACGDGDPTDCMACSTALGAAADGVCGVVNQAWACRPAAFECDVAETCDGVSSACPADDDAQDGEPCEDNGNAGYCQGGACNVLVSPDGGGAGAGGAAGVDAGADGAAGAAGMGGGAGAGVAGTAGADAGLCAPPSCHACPNCYADCLCRTGEVQKCADTCADAGPSPDASPPEAGTVDAGTSARPKGADKESGCNCRVTSTTPRTSAPLAFALLTVLAARRRRRLGA